MVEGMIGTHWTDLADGVLQYLSAYQEDYGTFLKRRCSAPMGD